MRGIKNIVFDLGGVLIDLDFPRALKAFEQAGLTDIAQNVQAFSREGIFMDLELGNITPEDFFQSICERSTQPISIHQATDYWNLILKDIPQDKLKIIRELRKRYHVYLLSNTNQPHWEYICKKCFEKDGFTIHDYFEKLFLSYEMHLAKPDKQIFFQMLQDGQMKPEETLFIDDSEANCNSAKETGIRTIHYRIGENLKSLLE
jgi:putative hydrolase of the HAD superfamily